MISLRNMKLKFQVDGYVTIFWCKKKYNGQRDKKAKLLSIMRGQKTVIVEHNERSMLKQRTSYHPREVHVAIMKL
jgi:hypothetical protein